MSDYIYLGDKLTAKEYVNAPCDAVRRQDGKCIRGANSNMLVKFTNGQNVVVLARRLRKIKS